MLSKACEYGIRALIYIVSETDGNDKRADIKQISKAIDSPHHFTAKILQQLTRSEMISSSKGPNGGFFANENTGSFKISQIIDVMGGTEKFKSCVLGLDKCSDELPCPLHNDYKHIRKDLNELFEKTSLRELTNGLDSRLSFLK